MNKLFRITAIILLILGSVVPVSAQRFHTSLPKYFEIEDANEWCSQQLTFEKAIEGIRITVFGTNTPNNIDYNIVGIAEIDIMDNDGNDITYSATANSVNGYVGNGLAGLNDNDIDKGYYQSAQEGPGNYVYIELTFDKPQSAFTFKMQRCSSGDNFPLQFTLSHLGNEAKPPFNPSIPSEPGGSQDDVAGLSYSLIYKVDGEVYKTETVEYGAAITLIDEPTKEGHTFSGWSEAPETMPANDIIIEGIFNVNSYTITYKVDGEVYKTETVAYGTVITLIDEPTKEGHTFSGWSEAPETMPAKDIVIEGSFTVNSYTITYIVDGEVYKTETVAYGAAITLIDEPTKEGHTFSGWSEAPETMPANDIIIEGIFNVNSYTITYKVDGEVYKTETVAYGTVITLIDEPTKEGHTFSGWSEAPETMPAKDIVIEGSFTVNSYTVTYMVDGEIYKTETVEYGSKISLPEHPVKEGYTFSGWKNVPETMPANDIEITGSFVTNGYTVTYMVDGNEYASYVVEYGAPLTLPAEPIKEGHSFVEWEGLPDTMPAKDITVNAKFRVNSYKVTYVVNGNEYASYDVEYGAGIPTPENPVKEGHTFSGWSEAPETMPAKDIVIEGSFTVNSYTITYIVDGEVYKTETVAYGAAITLIDEPTKEGHTFSGWSEAPETMPANDIIIEGIFNVNSYTITYKVDGEVYKTEAVAYGSVITLIDEPTKEGHTFSGWSEAPESMPANDIVIEGTFSVNIYTITYLVDGEVYATYTVEYGAVVPVPENPVKEGYIFEGWTSIPDTMPAEDVVIEAVFSADTGINGIDYDRPQDVYSLGGVLIKHNATAEDIILLPQGTYIIGGKKVYIRR